jgi:hypothetical protein
MSRNEVTIEQLAALGVRVLVLPMPGRIRGNTQRTSGGYLISINENLNDDARWEAFKHEMVHILRGDFNRDVPVEMIERDCGDDESLLGTLWISPDVESP